MRDLFCHSATVIQRWGVLTQMDYYARKTQTPEGERYQLLQEHLANVAALCKQLAEKVGCGSLGHLLGWTHDLGKYQEKFQQRLRGKTHHAPHAWVGSAWLLTRASNANDNVSAQLLRLLALIVASHHTGLPDLETFREKWREYLNLWPTVAKELPSDQRDCSVGEHVAKLPDWLRSLLDAPPRTGCQKEVQCWFRVALFLRFLLSALVDADRLDSAYFEYGIPAQLQGRGKPNFRAFQTRLISYVASKQRGETPSVSDSLMRLRNVAFEQCREAADKPQGTYSLTLPTGLGKTLSSMVFALGHAAHHDLDRVIVVIPYTSIIEQNAAEYANALGRENVLEHHSNFDFRRIPDTCDQPEDYASRYELAIENWDAPVIVTTTVQFFETLFSNHPTPLRKLHNIARSVIILDEVQTLPVALLDPCLYVLNALVTDFGCTVVLSTATPPAFETRNILGNIVPLISTPPETYRTVQKVKVEWRVTRENSEAYYSTWEELAQEIALLDRVLVVVSKREDAKALAKALLTFIDDKERDSVFHLSALMCPAHRFDVLQRIRERLSTTSLPCRVVSTQLVEAGVDLDFPVVYRALAGLDSVVQAAGRCNRERLLETGRVIIFQPPSQPPPGVLRKATEVTMNLIRSTGEQSLDPFDCNSVERFFASLYYLSDNDSKSIATLTSQLKFDTIAKEFRLIEDDYLYAVVVPYGESLSLIDQAKTSVGTPTFKQIMRQLQRYVVQIYSKTFQEMWRVGAVRGIFEDIRGPWYVVPLYAACYSDFLGLNWTEGGEISPEKLVL